jgi:hypothetical protein
MVANQQNARLIKEGNAKISFPMGHPLHIPHPFSGYGVQEGTSAMMKG